MTSITVRPKHGTSTNQPTFKITLLHPISSSLAAMAQVMKTPSGVRSRYLKIQDPDFREKIKQDEQWLVEMDIVETEDEKIKAKKEKDEAPHAKPNVNKAAKKNMKSYGILARVSEDYCFILKSISKLPPSPMLESSETAGSDGQISYRSLSTVDKPTLASKWKQVALTKCNDFTLSMTPPNLLSNSPLKEHQTPYEYFADKYYENLYQLSIPLTYFAKSSFTRLFNLCDREIVKYNNVLKRFVLSEEQLMKRHDLQRNGVVNQSLNKSTIELRYQGGFIEKNFNLLDLSKRVTNPAIIDILRVFEMKELQLQLLVILEIIHLEKLDDMDLFNEELKKMKLKCGSVKPKKKSVKLGKMKNFQKVLIPIRKPTTKKTSKDSIISSPPPTTIDYNSLLEENIEKILYFAHHFNYKPVGINDLTGDTNTFTTDTKDNLIKYDKFINSIVIPFFEKKCPNSVKFIIQKVRGRAQPSERIKRPTTKKSNVDMTPTETVIEEKEEDEAKDDPKSDISVKSTKSIPFQTQPNVLTTRPKPKPSLKRTTLKDHLRATPGLQRTSSDLLARQVSFISLTHSQRQVVNFQSLQKKQDPKLVKAKSTISIGKSIGKPQSQSQTQTQTQTQTLSQKSVTQVEATPMKKHKSMVDLDKSVLLAPPPSFNRSMTSLMQQSSATNPRIQYEEEVTVDSSPLQTITSSPISSFRAPPHSQSQHSSFQPTSDIVISSPIKNPFAEIDESPLNLKRRLDFTSTSSPTNEIITSSPMKEHVTSSVDNTPMKKIRKLQVQTQKYTSPSSFDTNDKSKEVEAETPNSSQGQRSINHHFVMSSNVFDLGDDTNESTPAGNGGGKTSELGSPIMRLKTRAGRKAADQMKKVDGK